MGDRNAGYTCHATLPVCIDSGTRALARLPDPGPVCSNDDPGVREKLSYIRQAWDRARSQGYIKEAITRHTREDFYQLVEGLISGLVMAAGVVAGSTAVFAAFGAAVGFFFGGIGAAPGAAAGARLGFLVGMEILEWLGIGFLVAYVGSRLDKVNAEFSSGARDAFNSCGAAGRIDAAARQMADAIGILFSLILQGIVAYLAKETGRATKGKMGKLADSKLFKLVPALEEWLVKNFSKLEKQYVEEGVIEKTPEAVLPDVSGQYQFSEFEANGKTYKQASGRLGEPGRVKTHRSKSAQTSVSGGTGDDAGHLIGNQFGAPGDARNLSQQNWIANRGGGTYYDLETSWANKLSEGSQVEVTVTDVTRAGEDRPFMREVKWTETAANGVRTEQELTFANTHTPKSRVKQNIEPTVSEPQKDNVIIGPWKGSGPQKP